MTTAAISQTPARGLEHERLSLFIGKWINEGYVVEGDGTPGATILTSDIYEWVPGGFFVLHTAYGRIGDTDVGGVELIGFDPQREQYRSDFFDSLGNITTDSFDIRGDTCTWSGAQTRCSAVFTDHGKTQTAHHERLDETGRWVPAMEVVLTKVE